MEPPIKSCILKVLYGCKSGIVSGIRKDLRMVFPTVQVSSPNTRRRRGNSRVPERGSRFRGNRTGERREETPVKGETQCRQTHRKERNSYT